MYPASKDQDAAQSGTGIYYQAVPAVAANGKNIMKLIPVQKVNGQFFQTDRCQSRTDSAPRRCVTTNIASAPVQVVKTAALNPLVAQQSCRKQVSSLNDLEHGNSQNKLSLQQKILNLTAKVHAKATPATNCDKSVRRRLPLTVTSPALPKGHHILIPPDAQVQSVPVSDLPPGIKKHICISSGNSSPELNLHSVVFVSPVTTVTQGAIPPNDSTTDPVGTANKTLCASHLKGSKPHLKLIPKVSQRPNSPIKWVIEENESSTTPNQNNLDSSPVTSENLQAEAMRKSGQGQENALVMYNGKVYLMAKKCSLPFIMDQSDSATSTKHYEFYRTTLPSSQKSANPVLTQTQKEVSIVIPDESDDIIDLCDDEESTQQEASVDEDNVIFVSYIPPKTELASQTNSILNSQIASDKGTKMDTNGTEVEEKCLDGRTSNDDWNEGPALKGRQAGQSMLVQNDASVYCSLVMSMHNAQSQHKTSTQQAENVNVDVETGCPADPSLSARSNGTCSEKEKDIHMKESSSNPTTYCTSSLVPNPCERADHLLRKRFGITTDVNICLQRVDETSAWSAQPLDNRSTSKANSLQDLNVSCTNRETDYSRVKKLKLLNGSDFLASTATPAPHTDEKWKNKCPSGQSSLCGSSCVGETAPECGYVEPIDEDFLSRHDDNLLKLDTCVELNTNTRRLGRTRKRTTCPCCTAGTLEHEADRLA